MDTPTQFPTDGLLHRTTCWTDAWWHPWASLWCLVERWRHANMADPRDAWQIFGNPLKQVTRIHLAHFVPDHVTAVFHHPVVAGEEALWQCLERPLARGRALRRAHLATCPQCLAMGFHSPFHQFELWHCCPFHGVPLDERCPHCGVERPYGLFKNHKTPPFGCVCGAMGYDEPLSLETHQRWCEVGDLVIRDPAIQTWTTLPPEGLHRIQHAGIAEEALRTQSERALAGLLDVAGPPHPGSVTLVAWTGHTVGPAPQRMGPICPGMPRDGSTRANHSPVTAPEPSPHRTVRIHQDLYQTFKCLSRRLRRTVLRHHRRCLDRQRQMPWRIGCPYAAAYLAWRDEVEGWRQIEQIDRVPRTQVGVGDWILPLLDWRTSPWLKPIRDQMERRAWMNTQDWADDRQDASDEENFVLWALRKQFGLLAAMRFRQWLAVMAAVGHNPGHHAVRARPEPPAQWRLTVVMVPDVTERLPAAVYWLDSPLANDTAGIWGERGRERQHELPCRWCRRRVLLPQPSPDGPPGP